MYAVCMYTLHYLTLRFILIHYIHWLSCMIMYVSLDAFVKCWVGPSIWECEHLNFWWLEANHLTRGGLPVLILHDFGSMKSFAPWESKPIYKLSSIYHQRMVQDSFPVSLFFSLRSSANMYSLHLSAVIFCTALLVSRSSASSGRPWSPDDRRIDTSWSSWMACECLRGLSDRHGMDSFRWLLMPVARQWSACHVGCYIEPWICQCKGNMVVHLHDFLPSASTIPTSNWMRLPRRMLNLGFVTFCGLGSLWQGVVMKMAAKCFRGSLEWSYMVLNLERLLLQHPYSSQISLSLSLPLSLSPFRSLLTCLSPDVVCTSKYMFQWAHIRTTTQQIWAHHCTHMSSLANTI